MLFNNKNVDIKRTWNKAKIDYWLYFCYNSNMRKLKRPLLKNLFEAIKSAFDSKKVDTLPKALFTDKDENKIKKDLAKNVFKKNGKAFEDDLKGFFEFITSRQMSFGASFYAKSKPTDSFLTLNVNNFFNQYGKPEGFENPTAFFEGLSLFLRERVTSRVRKITPEEKTEETFSASETVLLENYRQQLVNQFSIPENANDPTYGFMFQVAREEFSSCSLSKVKSFVEVLQHDIEKQKQFYTNRIKELEIEKITTKNPAKDRDIELCKIYLNYYNSVGVIESSFTYIRNQNLLKQPDNMLTTLIDKRIEMKDFENDLSMLQNINNLLVCMNTGLLSKDIYFNGKNFVCQSPYYDRNPFIVNNALGVIEQLPTLNRENQSILAYDEDYIKELLKEPKYPVTRVIVPGEKGQTRELTLYSTTAINDPGHLENCPFPMFIKSFSTSPTNENAEAILYAVAGPDISLATQICRVDKVPPIYRGNPSRHEQTSGEMLDSNTHVHGYNLFDKVTNFTPKKAGHFDITVNFNLDEQISHEQFEEFFDRWCSIPQKDDQVLITETEAFKEYISSPETSTEIQFIK